MSKRPIIGLLIYNAKRGCRQLARQLTCTQVSLQRVSTVYAALDLLGILVYNVVVLDHSTIGEDILNAVTSLKSRDTHCIFMVVMERLHIELEKRLFELGVDDVVVGKQASPLVLGKRIEVRCGQLRSCRQSTGMVRMGDILVDFNACEMRCGDLVRPLRGVMLEILKHFARNPDRIVSRSELEISSIWAGSVCIPVEEGGKTIDVNVSRLRKLMQFDLSKPHIIETVRGVGWRLRKEHRPTPAC